MRKSLAAIAFATFLAAPFAIHASPYDVYGASSRGAAMGSAQTAAAEGAPALQHNPALLALTPTGLVVGTLATFGRARVLLKERPDGYDVPDIGPPAAYPGIDRTGERSDTELQHPQVGLRLGASRRLFIDRLSVGFTLFLPLPRPVTLSTQFADERERLASNALSFERIGPKAHHLDIGLGAAYALTPWLAAGLGARYLPSFAVGSDVYLPDAADQAGAEISTTVETSNEFGLVAGLAISLPQEFELGLGYRDDVALRLQTVNEIRVNGATSDEPVLQTTDWTPVYSPARLTAGLSRPFGPLLFAVDARYEFWGAYEDARGDNAGFDDVISGSLGLEYAYTPATLLRFGAGFDPSPVPEQTGRTNYVDNDRVHFSLGAGHRFGIDTDREFQVDWYLRFQGLVARETFKNVADYLPCDDDVETICDEVPDDLEDPATGRPFPQGRGLQTGNPGFPGFVSGGWLGVVGLEVSYQ